MKKIVLISSFCDTEEKLNILKTNIDKIKSLGIDVLVISPICLPNDIVSKCDYFFLTKDNIVFDWPVKAMYQWIIYDNGKTKYKLSRTYPDYGYAGLNQVKQSSEIALTLNYDRFYHIIYDLRIDDNVLEGLNSDKICSVYPSKRGDIIWAVGLHFMIYDRENLKKFISYISPESYVQKNYTDAFVWLHNHQNEVGYTIEEIPVEDEIYYYENFDFFNYSKIDGLNFFIEKNDQTDESIKLFFYGLNEPKQIIVLLDYQIFNYTIENLTLIDLGFNKHNYKDVSLFVNDKTYSITETIKNVKHNVIEILPR
jgi:hypothetical protein